MKHLLLGLLFHLATTLAGHGQETTQQERALLNAISADDPSPIQGYLNEGGNPNKVIETLDFEQGKTLLHHAAAEGSAKVAELLLKSGADPLRMDAFAQYPIEDAIKHFYQSPAAVIQLLKRSDDTRKTDEIQTELLCRLLLGSHLIRTKNGPKTRNYVRLNGKDPSQTQMQCLNALGKPFAPFSETPFDPDLQTEDIKVDGFTITKVEVRLTPSADRKQFHWSMRISSGPLSGSLSEGRFSQQFGYWITETVLSAEE